jgi:hypothetical protein
MRSSPRSRNASGQELRVCAGVAEDMAVGANTPHNLRLLKKLPRPSRVSALLHSHHPADRPRIPQLRRAPFLLAHCTLRSFHGLAGRPIATPRLQAINQLWRETAAVARTRFPPAITFAGSKRHSWPSVRTLGFKSEAGLLSRTSSRLWAVSRGAPDRSSPVTLPDPRPYRWSGSRIWWTLSETPA